MSQYVYTMRRVGKVVPPKRVILRNISLNFFPGAKIGVLGLNGAGKSSLLKIMAGVDQDFEGEAIPQPNLRVGEKIERDVPQDDALGRHHLADPAHRVNVLAHTGSGTPRGYAVVLMLSSLSSPASAPSSIEKRSPKSNRSWFWKPG